MFRKNKDDSSDEAETFDEAAFPAAPHATRSEGSSVPQEEEEQQVFLNDDNVKEVAHTNSAPAEAPNQTFTASIMTAFFFFVLGVAIGFFLVFGIGARQRRHEQSSTEDIDIPPHTSTATPTKTPTPGNNDIFDGPTTRTPVNMPTTSPSTDRTSFVSTNYSMASLEDPLTLFEILPLARNSSLTIELALPSPEAVSSFDLYVLELQDVSQGSFCSSWAGSNNVTNKYEVTNVETATLTLQGIDTVVVLCIDDAVVARTYYIFDNAERADLDENNDNAFVESIDFSDVNASTPLAETLTFGPGVADRRGDGTLILYKNAPIMTVTNGTERQRELAVDAFHVMFGLSIVSVGDECPGQAVSEMLPPHEFFPSLTLYTISGTENQTVYACGDGDLVIGVVVILHVISGGPPSPTPTPTPPDTFLPTAVPSGPEESGTAFPTSETLLPTNQISNDITYTPTSSPTMIPSRAPTATPTAAPEAQIIFSCPDDTALLEFLFVPDARPGELGVTLHEVGSSDTPWNFVPRSFGSVALLLRQQFFALCLKPAQLYNLTVTDTGHNGLMSTLSGADIFGSFRLAMQGNDVVRYNGDCNAIEDMTECGTYCACTFEISDSYWKGGCSEQCGNEASDHTTEPIPSGVSNTATVDCPPGNSMLEFRVKFGGYAEGIGIRLSDPLGITMWNFPPGSFEVAMPQQEYLFSACLSPQQPYTIRIEDTSNNGLVTEIGRDFLYGSFSIKYNGDAVASYHGDCRTSLTTACGSFSDCTYELLQNGAGSTGDCT